MSNLALKLKALMLELGEDLLVHLVLISLPIHFGQFKVSYNTQKDKWSLNELISHNVQEEERREKDRSENVHSQPLIIRKERKLRVLRKGLLSKRNKRKMKNLPATFARILDT